MEEIRKRIMREVMQDGTPEEVAFLYWEQQNKAEQKPGDVLNTLIEFKKANHLTTAQLIGFLHYLIRIIPYNDAPGSVR